MTDNIKTVQPVIKRKPGRPKKNAEVIQQSTLELTQNSISEPTSQPTLQPLTALELYEISKCTYQRDNTVLEYKQNIDIIKFLLLTAIKALTHTRNTIVFEPIPYSWKKYIKQNSTENVENTVLDTQPLAQAIQPLAQATHHQQQHQTLTQLIKTFGLQLDLDMLIAAIESSYSDLEIIEKLGEHTYCFIKFVLMSNNTMIKPYNLLTSDDIIIIEQKDAAESIKCLQSEINSAVQQYKIIHTPLKEDQFKDADTFYLYHGTRIENVRSIMCNGLQCGTQSGSKSKFFLNGNAYGDGMYFSNDINMSLGYSTNTNTNTKTLAASNASDILEASNVLFIFEVKKNPEKNDWYKGNSIYVVNDEQAVILRFILHFKNNFQSQVQSHAQSSAQSREHYSKMHKVTQGIFAAINHKLNAGKIKEFEKKTEDLALRNVTTIHNKRLMREYAQIKKQDPEKLGFNIILGEDNINVWTIQLFRVDNDQLAEQMLRIGISYIEIEITFKDNYPFEPPFIRVVYPHFKFHSGHITVGGSLCMEMLTNQGWSPTLNVENIITQIKMAISDGKGEIDEERWNTRYTKDEAVDAFKRVLAVHGWV
uniref:UBC core domain-containing protein n=1 Tax=viral metagenome TaxID=1070528 RepID=A0A6C0HM66_9ZZZZ